MELVAGVQVSHFVAAAANLEAGAPVGRCAVGVKAEVAFAGNRHTESAVGEHFYAHELPAGALDALFDDGLVDVLNLVEVELTREHDHVRPLGIEAQGLNIGDGQLGGDVHLQPYAAAILDGRHIGGYNGVHARCLCGVEGFAHRVKVLLIKDYVESKVALDPRLAADSDDLREVFGAEVIGRMAAHIELPDPEIYGVSAALDGSVQAFEIARRGHYFQFFPIHFEFSATRPYGAAPCRDGRWSSLCVRRAGQPSCRGTRRR